MTNRSNYFAGCLVTMVVGGCSGPATETVSINTIKKHDQIEKAGWLIGSWHNNSLDRSSTEIWEKKNDSTLIGKSFFIAGTDTLSSETISLEQRENSFYYTPTVNNQNRGEAVKFKMTSSTENKFVFENPQHDFPTKITYSKINNDSLVAEISGMQNGKERKEQFPMSKQK